MTHPNTPNDIEATVEQLLRAVQVGSYHAHCFDDVKLRKLFRTTLTQQHTQHAGERAELIEALQAMYYQYCSGDDGRVFMSAGEQACTLLEEYTDMEFNDIGKPTN